LQIQTYDAVTKQQIKDTGFIYVAGGAEFAADKDGKTAEIVRELAPNQPEEISNVSAPAGYQITAAKANYKIVNNDSIYRLTTDDGTLPAYNYEWTNEGNSNSSMKLVVKFYLVPLLNEELRAVDSTSSDNDLTEVTGFSGREETTTIPLEGARNNTRVSIDGLNITEPAPFYKSRTVQHLQLR
jgi:hypothetical protein